MLGKNFIGVSCTVLKEWKAAIQMALVYLLANLTMRYVVITIANSLKERQSQLLPSFQHQENYGVSSRLPNLTGNQKRK